MGGVGRKCDNGKTRDNSWNSGIMNGNKWQWMDMDGNGGESRQWGITWQWGKIPQTIPAIRANNSPKPTSKLPTLGRYSIHADNAKRPPGPAQLPTTNRPLGQGRPPPHQERILHTKRLTHDNFPRHRFQLRVDYNSIIRSNSP